MNWIEITVRTNTAGSDMVSDLLIRNGASGTMIVDRFDVANDPTAVNQWDLLDQSFIENLPDDVHVLGYIPNDIRVNERIASLRDTLSTLTADALGFDAGVLALSTTTVRDEDWAENWKKYYKPFRVGKRLVVKPVWESFLPEPMDVILEIDPGMAFGNGTHETTSMCLALLETYGKPGDMVLDVGTGSGILSIAAAKLGATHVYAVDLDPVAVNVAKKNIAQNQLSEMVSVEVANLLDVDYQKVDLIVANIIADAIILLSESASSHLNQGGFLIASGIIREREQDVLAALETNGFDVAELRHDGEWVAVVARLS